MRRFLVPALKLGLAAVLVVVLLHSGLLDLRRLGDIGARWPWLLAAQVPFAALLLAAAVRWHLLLRARRVPIRFRDTYAIMLVGWLFNQTMPSSTGGDVAKAVAIAVEHPDRRSAVVMSIAVDRLTGLVALLAVALAMAALNAPLVRANLVLSNVVGVIAVVLVAMTAAVAVFYSNGLRRSGLWLSIQTWLERLLSGDPSRRLWRLSARLRELVVGADAAVYAYRKHLGTIASCVGVSVILHTMTLLVNFCLTWALLGRPFDWHALLLLIPLAHIGMALGITPGSIGVAEGVYYELFSIAGIEDGALVCILQRLTWYAWAAIGAAVLVVRRGQGLALQPQTGDGSGTADETRASAETLSQLSPEGP